nr:hypothetical protein [Leucobacter sp.]
MLANNTEAWTTTAQKAAATQRVLSRPKSRPKRLSSILLSGVVATLLAVSGTLAGPAATAFADDESAPESALDAPQGATVDVDEGEPSPAPGEAESRDGSVTLTQTVGTGGTTALTDYGEVVSLEALLSLSTGHSMQAGGVTKFTLDPSLKLANYGALPQGAQSQSWDEQTNTLTVTWKQLLSGGFYGVTINAVPSALATSLSEFRATAVTTGVGNDGSGGTPEITATATSNSLNGIANAFPADIPEVQPGDWILPPVSARLFAGGSSISYPTFSQKSGLDPVAFNNLQVVTHWNQVGRAGDELLPKAWVTRNEIWSMGDVTTTMQRLRDDAEQTRNSVGSQGGPLVTNGRETVGVRAAADALPGRYSVLRTLEDTRADGSTVVISSTSLLVTVAEDAATSVTFTGNRVPA